MNVKGTHVAKGPPLIGETLGHYEIVDLLGEGGMGTVYRAFDTRLRRDVAIKVLSGSEFLPKEERRRLLREARAAAPLSHPAIATVFEVADHEDLSFIVMEFVEGENLRAKVGEFDADPVDLARLGLAAVQGLRAAHENGVVHGDIKPENLMLARNGALKILGFGGCETATPAGSHHDRDHRRDPARCGPYEHCGRRERVNEHPPFSSLANTFAERFRDKGVEAHTFGRRRDCDVPMQLGAHPQA